MNGNAIQITLTCNIDAAAINAEFMMVIVAGLCRVRGASPAASDISLKQQLPIKLIFWQANCLINADILYYFDF